MNEQIVDTALRVPCHEEELLSFLLHKDEFGLKSMLLQLLHISWELENGVR